MSQPTKLLHISNKNNSPALAPYSDKAILPPSILESILSLYIDQTLPHPLIFQVTNLSNSTSCFIGVKEFTSLEETIILPQYIQSCLKLDGETLQPQPLIVHLIPSVPKGTSLLLKPIQNYSKFIKDWKWFLQSKLNNSYTTLTKNQILFISNDLFNESLPQHEILNPLYFKILIEDLKPDEQKTICIIDTDIDLEINQPINAIEDGSESLESEIETLAADESKLLNLSKNSKTFKLKLPKASSQLNFEMNLKDMSKDLENLDLIVSLDENLSKDNFIFTTLQYNSSHAKSKKFSIDLKDDILNGKENVYLKFVLWGKDDIMFTFNISSGDAPKQAIEKSQETHDENEVLCLNCSSYVPKQSFSLHEIRCIRMNKKCAECGDILSKNHWHCLKHDTKYSGDSETSFQRHDYIFHGIYDCKCGMKFSNIYEHNAADCELKLHECQFCHLILPQGKSTYQDSFLNLTNHENQCGNKTLNCFICSKIIKQKDLASHLILHDKKRLEIPKPQKCGNINCVSTNNINELNLCDLCYGPIYSGSNTPANLQNKIERKYVIQLTRGCQNTWCSNPECISSGLVKAEPITNVLSHIQKDLLPKIPYLPINKQKSDKLPSYSLCVSENIMKKKKIVDFLYEMGEYEYEWLCKSSQKPDEGSMFSWLKDNAVKIGEC